MTKYPEDFVHPIYGRVSHGVVVDEHAIKPVPDGTKRLNETHGVLFPVADPGPVKMVPPRKSQGITSDDDRNVIDTPEFKARLNAPLLPWLQLPNIDSPEHLALGKSGRALAYTTIRHFDDPLEQADDERYRIAVQARADGLPHDVEIIALYTSPEWRDDRFRAAYYEQKRKKHD
jgi:hypothetical protein